MSSYRRRHRDPHSKTSASVSKSTNAELKNIHDTKGTAVPSSENFTASTSIDALTLDDFGGRSDALGG